MTYSSKPIPARAGVGLKPQHFTDIFSSTDTTTRNVAWFEIHPENYFSAGGRNHDYLDKIRTDYPLSMHGVGLSLGSADGVDKQHLSLLKRLKDRYQPALFSEHLSWSRFEQHYSNDLLPIPYTKEALRRFIANVSQVQDTLGVQLLIENPSSYFLLKHADYTEWDFLISLCKTTGAKILLDINNIYVSAANHGFDAKLYIDAIPANLIIEIHLAGHTEEQHDFGRLLIDDHGSEVTDEVWRLYEYTIQTKGVKPTLIEWDTNIPDWQTLTTQAALANTVLSTDLNPIEA